MSVKAIFGGIVNQLAQTSYGKEVDAFLADFKELASQNKPIEARDPIRIASYGNEAAIQILAQTDDAFTAIELVTQDGKKIRLGIGATSQGIIANGIIPHPAYIEDPDIAMAELRNRSDAGQTALGTGPNSGSGVPADLIDPRIGITGLLSSLAVSMRHGHPPNTAIMGMMESTPVWWITDLEGFNPLLLTITDVTNDDYLVAKDGIGKSYDVVKPTELQVSKFNGRTVRDFSYEYIDPEHRFASLSGTDQRQYQVVCPHYADDDEIIVGWVANGKDMNVKNDAGDSICYIDMNNAARAWTCPVVDQAS